MRRRRLLVAGRALSPANALQMEMMYDTVFVLQV